MTRENRLDEEMIRSIEEKIRNEENALVEIGRLEHEEPALGKVLEESLKNIEGYLDFTGAPDEIKKYMKEHIRVAIARILASIRLGHSREWEARSGVKTQD